MVRAPAHPPERDDAEDLAEQLRDEQRVEVRVLREAARTEEDDEDHEWAVHIRLAHEDGADERRARQRFTALARNHGGWYDAVRARREDGH